MDKALFQALARWIKENPGTFRVFASEGLASDDGSLQAARESWAGEVRLGYENPGSDGIPVCVERLNSIVGTLKVTGGEYRGHTLSEYEVALTR